MQQTQDANTQAMLQVQQANQMAADAAQTRWTSRPQFSLKGGRYQQALSVRIYDATPGATIYYTVDRSRPTKRSTRYTGPVRVGSTMHLRAIAVVPGWQTGLERSAKYTIKVPVAPVGGAVGTTKASAPTS